MNIFVLEDDFKQQARLENIIASFLEKHQAIPKTFEIFGKPNQLLDAVKEKGEH